MLAVLFSHFPRRLRLQTKSGIKELDLTVQDGKVVLVKVDMGKVSFSHALLHIEVACAHEQKDRCTLMIKDKQTDFETLGREIHQLPLFHEKTNVNFVRVIDRSHLSVSTYERGAGFSLCAFLPQHAYRIGIVTNASTIFSAPPRIIRHSFSSIRICRFPCGKLIWTGESQPFSVSVNMGKASFDPHDTMLKDQRLINYPLRIGNQLFNLTTVFMTTLHTVLFVVMIF